MQWLNKKKLNYQTTKNNSKKNKFKIKDSLIINS